MEKNLINADYSNFIIEITLPEQMKDLLPSPEEIKKRLEGLDGENS